MSALRRGDRGPRLRAPCEYRVDDKTSGRRAPSRGSTPCAAGRDPGVEAKLKDDSGIRATRRRLFFWRGAPIFSAQRRRVATARRSCWFRKGTAPEGGLDLRRSADPEGRDEPGQLCIDPPQRRLRLNRGCPELRSPDSERSRDARPDASLPPPPWRRPGTAGPGLMPTWPTAEVSRNRSRGDRGRPRPEERCCRGQRRKPGRPGGRRSRSCCPAAARRPPMEAEEMPLSISTRTAPPGGDKPAGLVVHPLRPPPRHARQRPALATRATGARGRAPGLVHRWGQRHLGLLLWRDRAAHAGLARAMKARTARRSTWRSSTGGRARRRGGSNGGSARFPADRGA